MMRHNTQAAVNCVLLPQKKIKTITSDWKFGKINLKNITQIVKLKIGKKLDKN